MKLRLRAEAVDAATDAEAVLRTVFAGSGARYWLDSSRASEHDRFSYLGSAVGPLGAIETYDVTTGSLTTTTADGTRIEEVPCFDHLRAHAAADLESPALPFPFRLGRVGYLGYELKAQCGGRADHRSDLPDAAFLVTDRAVVVDHADDRAWVLGLSADDGRSNDDWVEATAALLAGELPPGSVEAPADAKPYPPVRFRHDDATYLQLIELCQACIRDGESYELCLTNQGTVEADVDPLALYRELRRRSPTAYAAYLDLGSFQVLSSSMERFLRVDTSGSIESKPIKGTRGRGGTPAEDEALRAELAADPKDRSENLMIVDLVRNDIGRVAVPASVSVPKLFDVETYATVHQLVSTVTGRLRPGLSPVDAVAAAFPPGSMTGAPKQRTMELLDALEAGPRGVYAGALGYLGLDGAVDLGVVIRTIVAQGDRLSFGVGGAIVALSDPAAELAETKLKAEPLVAAIAACRPRA